MKCEIEKARDIKRDGWGHPVCVDCAWSREVKSLVFDWQHKKCQNCIHNKKLIKCNYWHISEKTEQEEVENGI